LDREGHEFDLVVPDENAECGICSRETPPETVARLAYQKAENVVRKLLSTDQGESPSRLVLACDTVAECVGIVLGKPSSREHAQEMLQRLRGRQHAVYSGLCLWEIPSQRRLVRVDVTRLRMDPITDDQITEYLDTDLWEGKSGAFGFQDGPDWIHIVEGSESNVVGLPLELLQLMLTNFERDANHVQRRVIEPDTEGH
jgi:septum formation protein